LFAADFPSSLAAARNMQNVLPTISIVTLSYNQHRFLRDCLDSVLAEKADGVQYIVVDPGSTDGSRDLLRAREAEIDRLLFEPDAGPADGLNNGFAVARGEIFGYINSDDCLAPGAIEFVRRFFASRPNVDVLCGSIRIIDENGRASLRGRLSDPFNVRRYAARLCNIVQQGTFFRRSIFERVGGFNVANRVAWDGELLADMALANARFHRVRKVLGEFRVYRGTVSNSDGYRRKLERYYDGIERKLIDQGVRPYSRSARTVGRVLKKINVLRYAEQMIVR
jgi:glycosyltransferase involved in cell wall biosynthesis